MDRREFVKGAASALLLVPAALQLGACGDDTSAGGTDGGAGTAGTQGTSGTSGGTGAGAGGSAGKVGTDASTALDGALGEDGGALVDGGHSSHLDAGLDASLDAAVGDSSAADAGACPFGASDTLIVSNHGHSVSVPHDDVVAGVDKTYSIQGSSLHDHNIMLTAAHFAALSGGGSVTLTSTSGNSHTHEVTVACA